MNSSGGSVSNINELFSNAHEEGTLSAQSLAALTIPDITQQINAAMGTPAADVKSTEVFLVNLLLDDSGSIRYAGNEQLVRDGANMVRDALMASKARASILMCISYLNGDVPVPYTPIDKVPNIDGTNYQATGGTPLYDQTVVTLGNVLAKAQEFSNLGVPVRSATMIMTDGHDESSHRCSRPEDVLALMKDVLQSESHIVSAMGVQDGQNTDFRDIFIRMGIQDKWILTPNNTPHDFRNAFGTFSQSAVRASQGAAHFSQTALGGFGK